jgi:alanine-glyoxylate transaminase/serine-glyoxylate transaminase/serine-pyruvate transaminase
LSEGLENRFARHRLHHDALRAGLEAMGVNYAVPEERRLPMLNAVFIPDGADDKQVRGQLLNEFGIEIGGGLGPMAGKTWRIGLMGEAACRRNVTLFLSALESCLKSQGIDVPSGAGLDAANQVYAS